MHPLTLYTRIHNLVDLHSEFKKKIEFQNSKIQKKKKKKKKQKTSSDQWEEKKFC